MYIQTVTVDKQFRPSSQLHTGHMMRTSSPVTKALTSCPSARVTALDASASGHLTPYNFNFYSSQSQTMSSHVYHVVYVTTAAANQLYLFLLEDLISALIKVVSTLLYVWCARIWALGCVAYVKRWGLLQNAEFLSSIRAQITGSYCSNTQQNPLSNPLSRSNTAEINIMAHWIFNVLNICLGSNLQNVRLL